MTSISDAYTPHTGNAKKRDADAIKYCLGGLDGGSRTQGPILLQNSRMGIVGGPVNNARNRERGHRYYLRPRYVRG